MTDADVLAVLGSVAGGEREVLETFLDCQRGIVRRKATGLTEEQARQRHVSSATTVAGLVKHLTMVEHNWFVRVLEQRPSLTPDPGTSFVLGADETVGDLLTAYEAACARSRASAARFALDHVVPQRQFGQVSLRWILVHMIEETARHAGHADILRELTDGATGLLG
ncbi:DinB family protein [Streptomyces diastaticus]|uniref:DinB family protein n=1 Tax=Streptomyces diastaticus TaxID=1956 RepID=UPI0037F45EC0